jgi:hypothetical protein
MYVLKARESQVLQYFASQTSSTTVLQSVSVYFRLVPGNQHNSVNLVSSHSRSQRRRYEQYFQSIHRRDSFITGIEFLRRVRPCVSANIVQVGPEKSE